MEENCLIILDLSGSMKEEGKQAAEEYLICAILGFIHDYFPKVYCGVYGWAKNIIHYDAKSTGDWTKLNAGALIDFVKRHPDKPIILLSDGNFSPYDCEMLCSLSEVDCIRAVMIGADANRYYLEDVVGKNHVFEAADGIECVRQLLIQCKF